MEHFNVADSLIPLLVRGFGDEKFTLLDIGCSGGIDQAWRSLEPHLRAHGFDPNLAECERLRAQEPNPHVHYTSCFVRGETGDRRWFGRNPWARLAVSETIRVRAERTPISTTEELTRSNAWQQTKLADPNTPLYLPDFIRDQGLDDVDFIKIDVDGPDFDILQSLARDIDRCGVLAIGMEVNWIGSDSPVEHTFHNTDRYLRSLGFDLLDISVRKYALSAFPSRYLTSYPGPSVAGRPFQGDALYFRDLAADHNAVFASKISRSKFWRLAAILALFGKLDELAALITSFPAQFGQEGLSLLDELASRYGGIANLTSYAEYIGRFQDDAADFYPPAA